MQRVTEADYYYDWPEREEEAEAAERMAGFWGDKEYGRWVEDRLLEPADDHDLEPLMGRRVA